MRRVVVGEGVCPGFDDVSSVTIGSAGLGVSEVRGCIPAPAVADEPTVFWDGAGEAALVAEWKQRVGFREGDAAGEWGHARGVENGTSGCPVSDNVQGALASSSSSASAMGDQSDRDLNAAV